MTPYVKYLTEGTLPDDANEAKRVKKTAGWYTLLGGRLYWRGYSMPLLKCLAPEEAEYALSEVHLGLCGSHVGGKNLAFKVMWQEFYWPTMKRDAMEFVRNCESCRSTAPERISRIPSCTTSSPRGHLRSGDSASSGHCLWLSGKGSS